MGSFRLKRDAMCTFYVTTLAMIVCMTADAQGVPPPPSEVKKQQAAALPAVVPISEEPMSEALRAPISKVVLVPGKAPVNEEVEGSYDQTTPGAWGGAAAGAEAAVIRTEIGPVNVNFPIPILQLPGMLAGAVAGATKREIQDFRDALTEDLIDASSQQLTNEKIASDVYYAIRTAPKLEPHLFARDVPVPEDMDARLYISVSEVLIEVDKNEAVITATVGAELHLRGNENAVYETTVQYQDRDTLRNWTANNNAAWQDFKNFSRHYAGREIAARVFDSVEFDHSIKPLKSKTVSASKSNPWRGTSKKLSPTLAWELSLPGKEVAEANIYYDVEIYDLHRPVYSAKRISGSQHAVTAELRDCQSYRWSVRPTFHVNGDIRHGPWMRAGANGGDGNVGTKASEATAYLYDFASLEIKCGSR